MDGYSSLRQNVVKKVYGFSRLGCFSPFHDDRTWSWLRPLSRTKRSISERRTFVRRWYNSKVPRQKSTHLPKEGTIFPKRGTLSFQIELQNAKNERAT